MGMAASQARYLGLTARKTNVEYEGQQINQSRLALSNQSANLWNQMLGLSIPTVPSVRDYTTLQYSFNDGINTYTISDIQSVEKKGDDGTEYNKLVTYYFYEDVYKGVESTNSNPQVQQLTETTKVMVPGMVPGEVPGLVDAPGIDTNAGVTFNWDGTQITDPDGNVITPTPVDPADPAYAEYATAYKNSTGTDFTGDLYTYTTGVAPDPVVTNYTTVPFDFTGGATLTADVTTINPTGAKVDGMVPGEVPGSVEAEVPVYMLGNSKVEVVDPNSTTNLVDKTAVEQIIQDFGDAGGITQEMFENGQVYKYVKNGNTYYTTLNEIQDCMAKTKHNEDEYAISSKIDFQPSLTHYYATTIKEKVENTDYAIMDDASGSGRYADVKLQNMSTKFNLKAEETTNEAAYNDAMNQYNYDLNQYEKQMADINAKTSLIQEQDRTLELRLKQLETEQKALTTEMEAVKGVLQKNVEGTFGTFK